MLIGPDISVLGGEWLECPTSLSHMRAPKPGLAFRAFIMASGWRSPEERGLHRANNDRRPCWFVGVR